MTPESCSTIPGACESVAPHGLNSIETLLASLDAAADRVARGVPHVLLVLEVDRLEAVRTQCGGAGERALVDFVCLTTHHQLGPEVVRSRIDARRFALLCAHCLPRDGLAMARRLNTHMQGGVFSWNGLSFRVDAYVGVVALEDGSAPGEQVLARAEEACDAARSLGGDGALMIRDRAGERIAADREGAWRSHIAELMV